MPRRSRMRLSNLLLKKAEQVDPGKFPTSQPFPAHPDPHFRHPFGIEEGRNVLFMGSGEQFGRWAKDITTEVFENILMFEDRSAVRWQRREIAEKLSKFFGDPESRDLPALLWTGQYCIAFWNGVEESGREASERLSRGWYYERDAAIPLGYQAVLAEVPKVEVAAIIFDANRLLFAHPEQKVGKIFVGCYHRERPTTRGRSLRMRREAISLVVPGSGIDDCHIEAGYGPAYRGLTEIDGLGRPIYNNACYFLAMRLRPVGNGHAWAEDCFMVFDRHHSRLIEVSMRVSDFNGYTEDRDEPFARIVADYAHSKMVR